MTSRAHAQQGLTGRLFSVWNTPGEFILSAHSLWSIFFYPTLWKVSPALKGALASYSTEPNRCIWSCHLPRLWLLPSSPLLLLQTHIYSTHKLEDEPIIGIHKGDTTGESDLWTRGRSDFTWCRLTNLNRSRLWTHFKHALWQMIDASLRNPHC